MRSMNDRWRKLFEMGDALLSLATIDEQLDLIKKEYCSLTGALVDMYLSPELYYLPSMIREKRVIGEGYSLLDKKSTYSKSGINAVRSTDATIVDVLLPIEGEYLGKIRLTFDKKYKLAKDDRGFFQQSGSFFANILHLSRQTALREWELEQSSLALSFSLQTPPNNDSDILFKDIVERIQDTYHFYNIALFYLDPICNQLFLQSSSGLEPSISHVPELGYEKGVPLGEGLAGLCGKQGEVIISLNVHSDTRYKLWNNLPEICAEICLPLKIGEKVIGVLDIQSNRKDAFHENNINVSILETLSNSIAVAINTAKLFKAEETRSSIAESFQDIAEHLTTSFNLDDLLQIILQHLRDNFSVEAAAFWMLDENQLGNRDDMIFRTSNAFGVDLDQLQTNCKNKSCDFLWYQSTIDSRKPQLLSSDYGLEPIGLINQYSEYSAIASPILINDEPIGLLVLTHPKHNQYSVDTLPVIKTFTDYASVAIQNARLINTSLEQSWISNVMQQISETAQRYDNIEDQLEAITRIIPLMIDVNKCAVYLRGRSNNEYVLEAQFGYDKADEPKIAMLPFTEEGHMAIRSLEDGESHIKISSSFVDNHAGIIEGESPNCCLLLSLYAHEYLYGILLIDISEETSEKKVNRFPKTDALLSISQQIALSIENFQLKEARDFESYTTTVLLQSAEAIALAASMEEALENICNLLPFFIGVDTTIIYLLNQQQKTYHLNAYHSINWKIQAKNLPGQFREGAYPGLDLILREKVPAIFKIEEIPPEDWLKINEKLIFDRIEDYDVSTSLLMVFPLQLQEEVFGVMVVRESEEGFENREKKIEIINGIARQISVAVQNEQLKDEIVDRERMRREFQFAQEIQRTFLPEPAQEINGCEIQTIWRPALQLGGDFYDAFPLNNNKYGFVVADVSDKGIPAALYMTVARTLIHAAAKEGDGPSVTLERVNHLLIENSQEGLFITAIYGVMNLSTGSFIYSNAGHNKPLWLRKKQKEVQWLEKGGMPLGVMEKIDLKDHEIEMAVGDEIVMYTDGVTEGKSKEGEFFGEERLFNVLNAYKRNSSARLIDLIDEKLLEFQGSEAPSDDVTILIIKRVD